MAKLNITFEQYESERLYPLGYTFTLKRGKQSPRQCTILDYAIIYNADGSVVSFSYIIAYDFCGQRMTQDVPQFTIDMATNNGWKQLQGE